MIVGYPIGCTLVTRTFERVAVDEVHEITDGSTGDDDGRGAAPASRKWLIIAVVSTLFVGTFFARFLFVTLRDTTSELGTMTAATPTATVEPLIIAVGRTPGGQAEWESYVVLMRHLQDRLGRPVQLRYLSDREEAVESFKRGEADAGFVCTRSYLVLATEGIARALAVPVTSGASTETAMLLVRADSEYYSYEDLANRTVAISSRTSVSGAAYLYWLAHERNDTVDDHFGPLDISATQEECLRRLAKGTVDAAVGCSTEVKAYPPGTFRAVAVSPEYALPPFVVRTSLDEETVAALREALLDFDAEASLPENSELDGFVPTTENDYVFTFKLLDYVPPGIEKW